MELSRDTYLEYGPYLDLLTGVNTALSVNEGIIKVVGAAGAGKSAFCRKLESELTRQEYNVIYFESPPESPEYLHERIQNFLGLDKDKNFNKSLTNYLLAKSPPNHKLIVIYDNAELIDKNIFILIRLLNNIHSDSETLVSQIICGTEELDERFDDHDLRSLTQYLNQSFTLSPMDRNEIEDFCYGYAKETGATHKKFTQKEFTDIFMLGKGLPGKTIGLLENSCAESMPEKEEQPDSAQGLAGTFAGTMAATQPALSQDNDLTSTTGPIPSSPGETETESPLGGDTALEENLELNHVPEQLDEAESGQESQVYSQSEEEIKRIEALTESEPETLSSTENLEDYTREVTEILDEDSETVAGIAPIYFKAVLSMIVMIVTIVLAVVLSGGNETVNDQLADLLAMDTPLYMDEIASPGDSSPAPAFEPEQDTGSNTDIQGQSAAQDTTIENLPAESIQAESQSIAELSPENLDASTEVLADEIPETATADIQEAEIVSTEATIEIAEVEEVTAPEIVSADDAEADIALQELPDATIQESNNDNAIDDVDTVATVDAREDTAIETSTEDTIADIAIETSTEDAIAGNSENLISTAITSWLSAWQAGNFDAYLASYHDDYVPAYHDSFQEWRSERLSRIDGVQGITTAFDRLEILQESPEEISVRFWLYYSRNNYADETLKEIQFRTDGNDWKIFTERNIEIITN